MPIINVQGQRIKFPDSMSQSEISAILQKQFGEREAFTRPGESAAEDDPLGVSTAGLEVGTEEGQRQIGRQFAQGFTFGYSDELEAFAKAIGGADYEHELSKIRGGMSAFKDDQGGIALTAEIMGGLTNPAYFARVPKVIDKLSSTAQASLKAGLGGFLYGTGTADGDMEDRLERGAAIAIPSAIFGFGTQKIINKIGNKTVNAKVQKSTEETTLKNLKDASDAAMKQVDNNKEIVYGKAEVQKIKDMLDDLGDDIGYVDQTTHPKLASAKKQIETILEKNKELNLGQLRNIRNSFRQKASDAYKKAPGGEEYQTIRTAYRQMDDMMDSKLAAGGSDTITMANATYARYAKVRDLVEAFENAKARAKVTGTGGNEENLYRQAIDRILKRPDAKWKYTQQERDNLRQFAEGDLFRDFFRLAGGLSPTDSKLMSTLELGAVMHDPKYAIASIVGYLSKQAGKRRTRKQATKLVQKLGGVEETAPIIPSQPGVAPLQSIAGGNLWDYMSK